MNYDAELGLSRSVIAELKAYDKERALSDASYSLDPALPLPPEIPFDPGTVVAMPMQRYVDCGSWRESNPWNPWRGSGEAAVGVVAGVNYGNEDARRNHWYYRVVWQSPSWDMRRPDGEIETVAFSSEPGMIGWPHPWRHDLLIAMRGLPAW